MDTGENNKFILRPGEVAFTVVVIASYASLFSFNERPIYSVESLWLIVLGAIYLGIGLYGSRMIHEPPRSSILWLIGFLVFESSLAIYINFLSDSNAWLIILPLVGTAVEYLPRRWAIVTCGLIWLGLLIPLYIIAGLKPVLGWGMAFLSAIIFVAVFTQVASNERKARKELADANQKLREYAAQVEELAVTQERNRLAREIHDGLGHYLTAINIQLKAAQAVSGQDAAASADALANAQTLTQEALADVRRSISSLRADPSTNRPLAESLTQLLSETRAAGIQAEFIQEGAARPLSSQTEFTLYRVVQEGLTNVRKHSQASQVVVRLVYRDHAVSLSVQDNGVGSDEPSGGFGLVGIQERVQLVGGALSVSTHTGEGFKIEATIPS